MSALVGLVSIHSVTAQNPSSSIVPDTLDWKRYYPLSIGNEWQYDDAESGPHTKVLLVAKIEANGLCDGCTDNVKGGPVWVAGEGRR